MAHNHTDDGDGTQIGDHTVQSRTVSGTRGDFTVHVCVNDPCDMVVRDTDAGMDELTQTPCDGIPEHERRIQ